MALGKHVWDSADDCSGLCGVQSPNAARFYALGRMLAEAEVASLSGCDNDAAQKLRELQQSDCIRPQVESNGYPKRHPQPSSCSIAF